MNKWTHVVASYTQSGGTTRNQIRFYIDGEEKQYSANVMPTSNPVQIVNENIIFGLRRTDINQNNYQYKGYMDEIIIFNDESMSFIK